MIVISQLKLGVLHSDVDLENKIRKTLKLNKEKFTYKIVKRSLDARKKPDLFYVYTVHVEVEGENKLVARLHNPNVNLGKEVVYKLPEAGNESLLGRPVIVGEGPAGLFCAYILTKAGYHPIVLERGSAMEKRTELVQKFWTTGQLSPKTNVQFGEGGAGTFSDGKLNTVVKDPTGRNAFVLDTFIHFGAPEQIRFDAKPHIGTDILANVILDMRRYLEENGCEFLFETCMTDLVFENGRLCEVIAEDRHFKTNVCVLALGHSARDTFQMLEKRKLPMECKSFAVGFRVEHPQAMIDEAMYGKQKYALPAAPYKVTSNFPNGRGVYSFCMCPGGYVVNSSSYEGGMVVNGMSYSGRSGKNANSAIIVSVTPDDFGASDALSGMRFQEQIERKAFMLGDGKIPQQLFGDYKENRASSSYGAYDSTTKGATSFANLRGLFSDDMESSFMQGMEHFDRIVSGFSRDDAILSGVESRTSSPIRILRNEEMESAMRGIYPCGEGAGYAGGIMSAAMDGMKVAEAIIRKYERS